MNLPINKLNRKTSGFTLIEIIAAIAVSTPVLLLIFFYFTDIEKGHLFQSKRSEDVKMMTLYKKQIDAAFNSLIGIETVSEIEVRGVDIHDSLLTLRYTGRTIHRNNTILCDHIKEFKIEKDQNCEQKTVLFWECTLENGYWIGGGKLFK
jgi:prepilin-type N-terminal cleavage/methylation domain-containing protein